jgi:HlyD family secretion protein
MPLNGKSRERLARRRWITALALLAGAVVVAALVSCRGEPLRVRTGVATRGRIQSVISTNGKVEPVSNFEAHAPVSTTVQRVLVKEGDFVKKGQLLVELDAADAHAQAARAQTQMRAAQAEVSAVERGGTQEEVLNLDAQLAKARADHDTAQRNLDALRRLHPQGAASAGEVRQAEAALVAADAQLNLLQQKQTRRYSKPEVAHIEAQRSEALAAYDAAQDILSKSNVRAPFDGIVYALPVKPGVFVGSGDLVLQMADLRKVQVRAFVDEPDVARLTKGDPIDVSWDAVPGRTWEGAVNAIPSTVRLHGSRNVGETTCIVDNKDLKLLPNVNVGVTIVSAVHESALVVPREAVRMDDSKPYVLQVVGNELRRREVETSISNLTQVEITRGLSANDIIAISAFNGKPIGDGTRVKYY